MRTINPRLQHTSQNAWLGTNNCFIDKGSRRTVRVVSSVFSNGFDAVSLLIAVFVVANLDLGIVGHFGESRRLCKKGRRRAKDIL
jgi:hypothetical protein